MPDPANAWAVLIGASEYDQLEPLPSVRNNVLALGGLLTDPAVWGLPQEHVRVLLNPSSRDEVLEEVHFAAAGAREAILVYFGGHGLLDRPSSSLHLALPRTNSERLFRAVRYDELRREIVMNCTAQRKVVMIDCCFSGSALDGYMGRSADLADQACIDGTYVMTSCAETALALAEPGEEFTAFTGELVDILERGIPGEPDVLTMGTLYRQIHSRLLAKNRPEPQERTRNGGQSIALVRNRAVGRRGGASGAAVNGALHLEPGQSSHIAALLRALTGFAKSMGAAHSVDDVIRIAVREAQQHLSAAVASISMWERQTGRLRVLANHGKLTAGEAAFPRDESYPVSDFPEIALGKDDLGPWIQAADGDDGDPKRAEMLHRRGWHSSLIAPIVYDGRVWGELFAARTTEQPVYDREDVDFAAALTAQIAAGLAKADHMRQIERLAYTDQLTGVANRRSFDARLDAAIDRHGKSGTVVSLIICGVNGLKRMNDLGRDHGDALLVQLAGVMSAAAALLPGSLAARLSSNEFSVLIEGYSAEDAVRVAEELCTLALTIRGGEGVACGVASTGDRIGDIITRDRLFRLADAALYRAKRSGSLHPVIAGRGHPTLITSLSTQDDQHVVPDRRMYRDR